jgi:hypothetical protein
MFKMSFNTENAAFQDCYKEHEIRRILEKIAVQVYEGSTDGNIFDINCNKIGQWELTEE